MFTSFQRSNIWCGVSGIITYSWLLLICHQTLSPLTFILEKGNIFSSEGVINLGNVFMLKGRQECSEGE